MAEAFHKINEKLLDMHTEIVYRTQTLNIIQYPNDMLEIVDFVNIAYHDTYDVWRASSLSNEYYYNILFSLDKYVCAISFQSLMQVEQEEYKDLRRILDDLIVFLEEEYDFSNYVSIVDDLETAADVFSAALVIPVNNIYTRLVELRQFLNMVHNNYPTPVEDYMFWLNVNKYYAMNVISPNLVVVKILSYDRDTGVEDRKNYFLVPDMDPDEPGFDKFVEELGGAAFDDRVIREMLETRGSYIVENINSTILETEDGLKNNESLDCDSILEDIAATLFVLFILKDFPIAKIVGSLLKLLKLIHLHDLLFLGNQKEIGELVLDVIYLTKELSLKHPGISSIDEMYNYARLLRLVKLRVSFPKEHATVSCGGSSIFRGVPMEDFEIKMEELNAMDVRSYNTLKEVMAIHGRTDCSLCNTTHFVKKFVLCVNCPHLLCFTCLHYWINKSCTLTCPVCRELMPKLHFSQDFEVLKEILCLTSRQSGYIEQEIFRILIALK